MKTKKIALALLISALVITGCSKKEEPKKEESKTTSNRQSSVTSATKPKAKATGLTEIPVGQSFSDPSMKYDITVNRILTNVPYDSTLDTDISEGQANIFVEITGTNNSDYITSIGTTEFKIKTSNGDITSSSSTGRVSEYIAKEGLVTLYDKSIGLDETQTRWIIFEVPEKLAGEKLVLIYDREERNTYSDAIIPKFSTEIALN